MKKLTLFISVLLLTFFACDNGGGEDVVEGIHVTGVTVSQPSATLIVGGELTLNATVLPENATNKEVVWSSSDDGIASVANGLVTANAEGDATITVTTVDGTKTAECAVSVTGAVVEVTGITLDINLLRLPKGDKRTLRATVLPADATNKAVVWTSSNEALVTVTEEGLITGISESAETVVVTATTVDGSYEAMCEMAVIETAIDCTVSTPGWGESLGTVEFRTDKTWTVGEQLWSDVVVAEGCNKESFDSGGYPAYKADCRDNGEYGHLFSWAAVYRFQTEVCPAPWRVPTPQDYRDLDIAFGGMGDARTGMNEAVQSTYLSPEVWGGRRSGYCGSNGEIVNREEYCGYWTESQDVRYGLTFTLSVEGYLSPVMANMKYVGFPVRCVQ